MFDLQQEELKLIKVKALDEEATIPQKSHPSDAGFDIFTTESHTINSGESHLFST